MHYSFDVGAVTTPSKASGNNSVTQSTVDACTELKTLLVEFETSKKGQVKFGEVAFDRFASLKYFLHDCTDLPSRKFSVENSNSSTIFSKLAQTQSDSGDDLVKWLQKEPEEDTQGRINDLLGEGNKGIDTHKIGFTFKFGKRDDCNNMIYTRTGMPDYSSSLFALYLEIKTSFDVKTKGSVTYPTALVKNDYDALQQGFERVVCTLDHYGFLLHAFCFVVTDRCAWLLHGQQSGVDDCVCTFYKVNSSDIPMLWSSLNLYGQKNGFNEDARRIMNVLNGLKISFYDCRISMVSKNAGSRVYTVLLPTSSAEIRTSIEYGGEENCKSIAIKINDDATRYTSEVDAVISIGAHFAANALPFHVLGYTKEDGNVTTIANTQLDDLITPNIEQIFEKMYCSDSKISRGWWNTLPESEQPSDVSNVLIMKAGFRPQEITIEGYNQMYNNLKNIHNAGVLVTDIRSRNWMAFNYGDEYVYQLIDFDLSICSHTDKTVDSDVLLEPGSRLEWYQKYVDKSVKEGSIVTMNCNTDVFMFLGLLHHYYGKNN